MKKYTNSKEYVNHDNVTMVEQLKLKKTNEESVNKKRIETWVDTKTNKAEYVLKNYYPNLLKELKLCNIKWKITCKKQESPVMHFIKNHIKIYSLELICDTDRIDIQNNISQRHISITWQPWQATTMTDDGMIKMLFKIGIFDGGVNRNNVHLSWLLLIIGVSGLIGGGVSGQDVYILLGIMSICMSVMSAVSDDFK